MRIQIWQTNICHHRTYPPLRSVSCKHQIRCMDLGNTALGNWKAQQGGCTHIQVGEIPPLPFSSPSPHLQFFNEINDLKCTNCGMEFSKHYLRQNLLMEVRGVPA
ncbi:hypothetical protein BJV74DRAFT_13573 [Russula compacta]|nr:hypothetical protein BJV74DRAFT_13573 [Russula compacta]